MSWITRYRKMVKVSLTFVEMAHMKQFEMRQEYQGKIDNLDQKIGLLNEDIERLKDEIKDKN